jgi:hypothetical protein
VKVAARSAVFLILTLSAACTGSASHGDRTSSASRSVTPQDLGAPSPTPSRYYSVHWDSGVYDVQTSGQALAACTSLPGAAEGGTAESLPPINSLVFSGTDEQRKVVEDCLNSLPGGRVETR